MATGIPKDDLLFLLRGERVGRYLVEDVITQTLISQVYIAKRVGSGEKVVLKNPVYAHPPLIQRMKKEPKLGIKSDFVINPLECFRHKGNYFLAYPYKKGSSLQELLPEGKSLSLTRSIFVVLCILKGIAAIGSRGIVHTDIKPGNVLIPPNWKYPLLIDLTNFEYLSKTPTFSRGTLLYAPPELLRGERLSQATDIYSTGALIYKTLVGISPHKLNTQEEASEIENRIASGQPIDLTPLSKFDGDLIKCIEKATLPNPQKRYQEPLEMYQDLQVIYERCIHTSQKQTTQQHQPVGLMYFDENQKEQTIPLTKNATELCRKQFSNAMGISRKHALIRWGGQHYLLQDDGSKNGTYLNGLRLASPARINVGDKIMLGSLEITVI